MTGKGKKKTARRIKKEEKYYSRAVSIKNCDVSESKLMNVQVFMAAHWVGLLGCIAVQSTGKTNL